MPVDDKVLVEVGEAGQELLGEALDVRFSERRLHVLQQRRQVVLAVLHHHVDAVARRERKRKRKLFRWNRVFSTAGGGTAVTEGIQ